MRITFVTPFSGVSGGIKILQGHARRLAERGHDVFVISQPSPRVSLRDRWRSFKNGHGWRTISGALPWPNHPRLKHVCLNECRSVVNADLPDADVVIATWWETANWVAELAPSKGAKCYFVQADERMFFPPAVFPGIHEKIVATWRLPMHFITISNILSDALRQHGVDNPDQITNPVDFADFSSALRTRQSVFTVGTLHSEAATKGSDIAYDAMRLAKQEIPNLRALCFGAAKRSQNMPAWAEFSLRPSRDEIRRIYSSCDLWLFASREEGYGLPILEAMASRTPVVGTPAGAAPELIPQGGGVLVPLNDPQAMAQQIINFARMSVADWQHYSDRAFATAQKHDWPTVSLAFEASLAKACNYNCTLTT